MYINDLKQIPSEPHWAIIKTSSIWIPGDERSKTNPGHGYPEHSETTISYQVFKTEEEWKAEVVRLSTPTQWSSRESFKAVKVIPAIIKTSVDVKVD